MSLMLLLSACGTSEHIATSTDQTATEAKPASTSAPASPQQAPTPAPEPEEAIVEVIPGKAKPSELTIEPIPEQPPAAEPTPEPATTPSTEPAKSTASPATSSTAPVPVPKGPNDFVITTANKDATHPFFGKGFPMGFLINGAQGKAIVMERGKTYHLMVATDPMHDVYISTKDIGWGSTPYTEGVEGMYTYKGTITIKPSDSTPDTLYYSCRNHPFMGGVIHVVNPGQSVKIAKQPSAQATTSSATNQKVTVADVNQKIMFADMLLKSKTSQTVLNSHIPEAVALQDKAKTALQTAKDKLKSGDTNAAYKNADQAVVLLQQSSKLVPNESEIAHLKDLNKELLTSIEHFEASHKENFDRVKEERGAKAAVDYDRKQVDALKNSAKQAAAKGDYRHANQDLERAQRLITEALHSMLDKQTIVYDLNFKTAEDEYKYELKRFGGYEELIPIAVEQKKPNEGVKQLVDTYVKKGQKLHDMALQKAKEKDFPTAIAMLQDATLEVQRALRMMGVSQ